MEGQGSLERKPVYLEADEMDYDKDSHIITARGNVQAMQDNRIVRADEVVYEQDKNLVTAAGNVSLMEADGTVYFGDKVELKDDLKEGIVESLKAKLSDGSLLTSDSARRMGGNVVKLNDALYTPCKICEDDPTKPPLWRIKAKRVKMDQEKQKMTYRDARLEVYGVPVLYTPYFTHPTPDAPSKTGILTPTWKGSNSLGARVDVPFFMAIKPNMDATITPIYTSKEGMVMGGEYRYLNNSGSMKLQGSVTNPQKRDNTGRQIGGNEFRGHVEGVGNFALSDAWSWGFNGKRSSDDTYLARYGFGYEDYLTSQAYVDRIASHDYLNVRTISFQGLRQNYNTASTPLVLPEISYYKESAPGDGRVKYFAKANALSLTRDDDLNTSRTSGTLGARLPGVTPFGLTYEAGVQVRADYYNANNYSYFKNGRMITDDGAARAIPEASLKLGYPFISTTGRLTSVIEPIASFYAAPNGYDPLSNPNEDSQVVELDYLNLFDSDRFPGFDRFEQGIRANYGLRGSLNYAGLGNFDYAFGRGYVTDENPVISYLSRESENSTDYVGFAKLQTGPFQASYRYRLRDNLALSAGSLNTSLGFDRYAVGFEYDQFNKDPVIGDRKQGAVNGSVRLGEFWNISAYGRRDFSDIGGPLNSGVGLVYSDECLTLTTGMSREFTRDRDIKPNTSFLFRVALKNLE